jgi:flagellar motility protein MotE (MotC chaperone)
VALLVASAVLRLGPGLGEAVAQAAREPAAPPASPATAEPGPDLRATVALLEAVRAREREIAAREAMFEDRVRALAVAEEEARLQIARLTEAEARLAATLSLADGAAEADIARLVAVYQAMRPEQAAALFSEMEPDFAAGFLARMAPESAAQVLAGLDPGLAYSMTVTLAGRNARAPRE